MIVIFAFIVSDFSYAITSDCSEGGSCHTLAVSSPFQPPAWIEQRKDDDGKYILVVDSKSELEFIDGFPENAGFVYLRFLIAQIMEEYHGVINASGLVDLIGEHLEHIDFTGCLWENIYEDGDSFCLPCMTMEGQGFVLTLVRFYLTENRERYEKNKNFASRPIGNGSVRMICEKNDLLRGSDVLMRYVEVLRGQTSLIEIMKSPQEFENVFFKPLYHILFYSLGVDFDGSEDFVRRGCEIIKEEGVLVLRNRMIERDDSLYNDFKKIKLKNETSEASIGFYGVLFFLLYNTLEYNYLLREPIENLYYEACKKELFPGSEDFTGAERGIHHKGEEVFEIGGRRFTIGNLRDWNVTASTEKKDDLEWMIEKARRERKEIREVFFWPAEHLYSEFIKTRTANEIALGKRGISHHIQGHSFVQHYPKRLLFEGKNAHFMDSIMYQSGETEPKNATKTYNARKIAEAVRVWAEVGPEVAGAVARFLDTATVVELDMDTMLLVSDPEANVVRPLQIGRSRKVFYLSRQYLDSLDINNPGHMRELAFYLKLGQSFLDKYDMMARDSNDQKDIERGLESFNEHFLQLLGNNKLVALEEFKKRLSEFMESDFIVKYTDIMEEILQNEQEIVRIHKEIHRKKFNFNKKRAALQEIFQTNYDLLTQYSGLGMDKMSYRIYNRMKNAVKALQKHDPSGKMPYDSQRTLIFTALKFGYWEDYLTELESLLTGKGSRFSPEEEVFARDMAIPVSAEGDHSFENELMKALHSQMDVMQPDEYDKYVRKTEELLRKARELVTSARGNKNAPKTIFAKLVCEHQVIELEGRTDRDDPCLEMEEALRAVSEVASQITDLDKETLFNMFRERELQSSTAVSPHLALPHIALAPGKPYEILLVRAKDGVKFPGADKPVNAMFVLMVPRGEGEDDTFHLKIMSSIARAMQSDFIDKWMEAANEEEMRELVFRKEKAPAKENAPPGSIKSVFEYLCEHRTGIDDAPSVGEIALKLERSPATIQRDLIALHHYLGLIEKTDVPEKAIDARYYVTGHVVNRMEELLPVLSVFTGSDLQPKVEKLAEVYKCDILPILNMKKMPTTAMLADRHSDEKPLVDQLKMLREEADHLKELLINVDNPGMVHVMMRTYGLSVAVALENLPQDMHKTIIMGVRGDLQQLNKTLIPLGFMAKISGDISGDRKSITQMMVVHIIERSVTIDTRRGPVTSHKLREYENPDDKKLFERHRFRPYANDRAYDLMNRHVDVDQRFSWYQEMSDKKGKSPAETSISLLAREAFRKDTMKVDIKEVVRMHEEFMLAYDVEWEARRRMLRLDDDYESHDDLRDMLSSLKALSTSSRPWYAFGFILHSKGRLREEMLRIMANADTKEEAIDWAKKVVKTGDEEALIQGAKKAFAIVEEQWMDQHKKELVMPKRSVGFEEAGDVDLTVLLDSEDVDEDYSDQYTQAEKSAQDFINALIYRIEMKAMNVRQENEDIIIGIDVSLIPIEQRGSVINGLLNRLSHLRDEKGFGNIIIRCEEGVALAGVIKEEIRKERKEGRDVPMSNIILLGSGNVFEEKDFDRFRESSKPEEHAFFAEVDKENIKSNSYIRLISMLTIAVKLAFGETVLAGDHPNVRFSKKTPDNSRYYTVELDAEPFDYAVLKKMYQLQRNLIDVRA